MYVRMEIFADLAGSMLVDDEEDMLVVEEGGV